MSKSIIINAKANVLRAAVIKDKTLDNLFIDQTDSSNIVGNIYLGKIAQLVPSIQAAFIDIGIEKNGFLQLNESEFKKLENKNNKNLKDSKKLLVQVIKEEIGTKGVRLEPNISLPGRFLVFIPNGNKKIHISRKIVNLEHKEYLKLKVIPKLFLPKNSEIIIRTAAAGVKAKYIARDLENLVSTWKQIQTSIKACNKIPTCVHEELDLVRKIVRDWLDTEVSSIFVDDNKYFDKLKQFIKKHLANSKTKLRKFSSDMNIFDKFGITRQIEKLYDNKIWLKCGGYIVIDKMEALVAIDVNTGKNIKHANSADTILETNLEAASEIARQLRLRNMGGIVIIDFIDMKKKLDQKQVLKHLQRELELDKAKSKIYPFTKLGLVQMTRQRVEEAWEQHYFVECVRCKGTGRTLAIPVISDQIISQIKRFLILHPKINLNIRANPEIIDFLLKNKNLQTIEKQFRIEIGYLKDDSYYHDNYLIIRKDKGINILK